MLCVLFTTCSKRENISKKVQYLATQIEGTIHKFPKCCIVLTTHVLGWQDQELESDLPLKFHNVLNVSE